MLGNVPDNRIDSLYWEAAGAPRYVHGAEDLEGTEVDVGALDRSLSALAPGQSEHPGHRHYADGLAPWLEDRSTILPTARVLVEESALHRLLLEPGP